jgi:hypothetical protein
VERQSDLGRRGAAEGVQDGEGVTSGAAGAFADDGLPAFWLAVAEGLGAVQVSGSIQIPGTRPRSRTAAEKAARPPGNRVSSASQSPWPRAQSPCGGTYQPASTTR